MAIDRAGEQGMWAPRAPVFAFQDQVVPGENGIDGLERGATVVRDAEVAPDVIFLGVWE
jgi:hypothetical protein